MGLLADLPAPEVFAQALPQRGKGKVLICLFQRGAADALNIVVPHGERAYYALRPNIAIPRPGDARRRDRARRILRAAPRARAAQAALGPRTAGAGARRWQSEQHALALRRAGLHGDRHAGREGNAGRLAQSLSRREGHVRRVRRCATHSPFRAVALTQQTPRILEGPAPTVAMNSLDEFTIRATGIRPSGSKRCTAPARPISFTARAREMFDAVKMLRAANPQRYAPRERRRVSDGRSSASVSCRSRSSIKANVGLEIAFADVGGWDTHVNQGGATGQLANRLDDFSQSIAALVTDLGDRMDDVVIMTMSRVRPHGDARTAMVARTTATRARCS